MTDEQKIQAEKNELNLLIEKGVSIEVERKVSKRKPGFWGYVGRRYKITEKLTYVIKEPTLAVLDLISSEQIDLVFDESILENDSAIQVAKRLTKEHCRRMAKILAYAVIGEDYFLIEVSGAGKTVYKRDDKRLNNLTQLFFHSIHPSILLQYCILINTMSNFGDFMNSIRLMSASRTTMPNRIEENKQG